MSAARSPEGTGADDGGLALGLVRIGSAALALPVNAMREVISRPSTLEALPLPAAGLAGAVSLRGCVVPVLDLRDVLGIPRDDGIDAVIVVMRHGGKLLGLLASEVLGTTRVAPSDLQALQVASADGAGLATHAFGHGGNIATLLDAARIAALPGVPMVDEPAAAPRRGAAVGREPLLLFDCGGLPLGIAAICVEATVPPTAVRPSPLKRGLCRGVIDHHGHEVPVVDTLGLLGLGTSVVDAEEASAVLVLRFAQGRLGLMLDSVRDIARVATTDILPLPPLGLAHASMFRGVLPQGADQHLLIDAAALETHTLLHALASMSRSAGATRNAAALQAGAPFLTYRVGVETASPLTQVSEILPFPSNATQLPPGDDAAFGLFTHRGSVVPLVCLATRLGRPVSIDPTTARVLLVESGGWRIGFVVQALCSIETAMWEAPHDEAASARRLKPVVEVGQGEHRRTLPRLDLERLLRSATAAAIEAPIEPVAAAPAELATAGA